MTAPIAPPLTPPQLAVLQKPLDGTLPAEPAPPAAPRTGPASPPVPRSSGRGRLLDIVV